MELIRVSARATLVAWCVVTFVAGLASCGGASADRASVCGAYDELGEQALSPHPFSDRIVFRKARELADEAARYDTASAVHDQAGRLEDIGESDSMSFADLREATTAIAALCGHPLGVGSTADEPEGDRAPATNRAAPPQETQSSTTTTATSEPTDEDEIREVMRRWGEATDPAELCSLETAAAQEAEIAKSPGAESCEEAVEPGPAISYPSIEVTMTLPDAARVEVPGNSIPSYSLVKVDGTWKIDEYGTHLDMGSPDAGPGPGSLPPESCGAGTGRDC